MRDVYDVRIRILRDLVEMEGGSSAFLSGILSGFKVQDSLMTLKESVLYDSQIKDFIYERHYKPISEIVHEYNSDPDRKGLFIQDFQGESLRRSASWSEEWYQGFTLGMVYVVDLYNAFKDKRLSKVQSIGRTSEYLKQVYEWVDETQNLRSHLHG